MAFDNESIQTHFDELEAEVEAEVRRRARAILRKHRSLNEFVKAMGGWFFTKGKAGDILHDSEDDPRFTAVAELIEEWDQAFGLTGDPVRFTAKGPEVTAW